MPEKNKLKLLFNTLKKDERLVVDGKLAKNKVIELALQLDIDLLRLLLSSKDLTQTFFQQVEDVLVFDKVKFQSFVSNKQFLPDSFTEYKNKTGLSSDKQYLTDSEEVVLAFPYKDCVLEGGQTKDDAKRNEMFWNETLASDEIDKLLEPKVLTTFKKYDSKGEHPVKDFSIKDNLLLKGNNLLTLYSLREKYKGKIKLIYIDPPYNTGSEGDTFVYNNHFKHSSWNVFIKNRLQVAKELLREDGFIAITIDHAELFYMGVLGDEIFGRDNRVGIVTIVHKPEGRNQEKFFGTSNEFMLVYAKNKDLADFEQVILDKEIAENFGEEDGNGKFRLKNFIRLTDGKYSLRENKPHFFYPIYVSSDLSKFSLTKEKGFSEVFPITEKGIERTWKTTPATFIKLASAGSIVAEKEGRGIVLYEKLRENQVIKTHWIKKEYHAYHFGTKLLEKILGTKEFSFPKSLYAVVDTLKLMTSGDDIVLDFFAGSGTTAHAVLALNEEDGGGRRFILCEQMDYIEKVTRERIKKVIQKSGKGEFVYAELTRANQLFVDKVQDSKNAKELLKVWEEMKQTAFLSYKVKPEEIDATKKDFETLSFDDQQRFLISILDKNLLYVPYSEIEDKSYKVSKEDIALNSKFYGRN
jgi:adenine-specific DNA-methyltransferase